MDLWIPVLCDGHSALENDKDQQHKIQIKTLQDRIRMLEASVQNELSEKAKVLDSLAHERGKGSNLEVVSSYLLFAVVFVESILSCRILKCPVVSLVIL